MKTTKCNIYEIMEITTSILFLISEILPFIKVISSNGIFHMFYKIIFDQIKKEDDSIENKQIDDIEDVKNLN